MATLAQSSVEQRRLQDLLAQLLARFQSGQPTSGVFGQPPQPLGQVPLGPDASPLAGTSVSNPRVDDLASGYNRVEPLSTTPFGPAPVAGAAGGAARTPQDVFGMAPRTPGQPSQNIDVVGQMGSALDKALGALGWNSTAPRGASATPATGGPVYGPQPVPGLAGSTVASAGPEDPYPAGFEQRPPSLAGPVPGAPPAAGAGVASLAGPEQPYPPGFEQKPPANLTTPALPSLSSGGLDAFLKGGVGERLFAEPQLAMIGAFQSMGVDPNHNVFAQMAIKRYAPIMQSLAEVWSWVATGTPDSLDMNTLMPQFLAHFMQGGDVKGLMAQAFKAAESNPNIMDALQNMDPMELSNIMETTRGSAPMMRAARQRRLAEQLQQRQIAELSQPLEADDRRYIDDVRRIYGV